MKRAYDVSVSWAMDATVKVWADTPEEAEDMVDQIQTHHLDGSCRGDSYNVEEVDVDPKDPPECSDVELLQDWLAVAIVHPSPTPIGVGCVGDTWNVGVETTKPETVLRELISARPAEIGEHPDEILLFHCYKGTPRLLEHWKTGEDYPNS